MPTDMKNVHSHSMKHQNDRAKRTENVYTRKSMNTTHKSDNVSIAIRIKIETNQI